MLHVLFALALLAVATSTVASGQSHTLRRHRRRLKFRLRHVRDRRRQAAARRREAALERRAQANAPEAHWDAAGLRQLVIDAFDPVQSRWRPHDAQQSRTYVSDAFYDRHTRELEQLEARRQTRRIVVSSLESVEIVGFDSATTNDVMRVVARVRFRAYETLSDSRTARVIDGAPRKRRAVREDWTLVWHPTHGWLIDDLQRLRRRLAGFGWSSSSQSSTYIAPAARELCSDVAPR